MYQVSARPKDRQLLVDEQSDAGFLSTQAQFVGRNEAANRRVYKDDFRRGEISEWAQSHRSWSQ
jgi:hypothetical protein